MNLRLTRTGLDMREADPAAVMAICPACGYPSAGLCAYCRPLQGGTPFDLTPRHSGVAV
jgi:hypothetical protein